MHIDFLTNQCVSGILIKLSKDLIRRPPLQNLKDILENRALCLNLRSSKWIRGHFAWLILTFCENSLQFVIMWFLRHAVS